MAQPLRDDHAILTKDGDLRAKDAEIAALKDANETLDNLMAGLIENHSTEVRALRAELAAVTAWGQRAMEGLLMTQGIYPARHDYGNVDEKIVGLIADAPTSVYPPKTKWESR